MPMAMFTGSRVATIAPVVSALETAANALSANAAALFTMGEVPDISNNAASSILEYVYRACWDAGSQKIRFLGIQHEAGWAQYCEYDAATDGWSQESVPDSPADPRHGYSGFASNDAGVCFFHQGNGGDLCHKRTSGGTWSTYTNPQAGWANVEWSPGLSKFIIGQIWGIRTFDPSDNSFAVLRDTPGGTDMSDPGGASAYSHKDSCVYVGRTSGANPKVWKVNGSGTCTQIVNPPATAAILSAMLIGAANPANKLMEITAAGACYEYDEGGDSWGSDISGGAFPAALTAWIAGASNNQWIACPIIDYGVIAFMRQTTGDAMDPDMYLWKH